LLEQIQLIQDAFGIIFGLLINYWWLYLPVFLFFIWFVSFENLNRLRYLTSLEWVILEIKIPRDINKSPKAMEQIFAALYGIYFGPVKWKEKFFKGKVPDWFVFEIAGTGGEIHFYVRTPKKFRNLVESQIYAQYPDAELIEVEDYLSGLPLSLPNNEYDLWGGELVLSKEDAYPIRTYLDFEEKSSGPNVAKRIDPIASFAETIASLEYREYIIIQLLIRPAGDDWIKKGQAVIDKLLGKKQKPKEDWLQKIILGIDAVFGGGTPPVAEQSKEERLTPGKQDIIEAIERSFTKLGFESGIRMVYIYPKDMFHLTHLAALNGAFKQFASPSLNSFKLNGMTTPPSKGFMWRQKAYKRKSEQYRLLRKGLFVKKPIVLNTEELATIYHFPDITVKAPLLPRVESRKGEPPAGLPIG
jgi:hypothetical protein